MTLTLNYSFAADPTSAATRPRSEGQNDKRVPFHSQRQGWRSVISPAQKKQRRAIRCSIVSQRKDAQRAVASPSALELSAPREPARRRGKNPLLSRQSINPVRPAFGRPDSKPTVRWATDDTSELSHVLNPSKSGIGADRNQKERSSEYRQSTTNSGPSRCVARK